MDSTAAKIVRSQDSGPGRAGGQKIENHHMGDYRHMDMFSRTECDPEIDSAQLEIQKSPFKRSNWGEKLTFQR